MAEEQRLINLEREVSGIKNQVNDIEGKVDEIKAALVGNEYSTDKGYLHRQAELEKRILRIEMLWQKGKWFLIGMAGTAGYGASAILSAVASIISKILH